MFVYGRLMCKAHTPPFHAALLGKQYVVLGPHLRQWGDCTMCRAIVYDARHEWHEMIESDKYEFIR